MLARNKNPLFPNFLDFKDLSLKPLNNAMDNLFKDLCREGIGSHGLKKNLRREDHSLKKLKFSQKRMKVYFKIQTQLAWT